jgi:hypothetical protein
MHSPPMKVVVLAMLLVALLEAIALLRGIDGVALSAALAILGALAGVKIGQVLR